MDIKTIIVVLLVVAAVALAYVFLYGEQPVEKEVFLESLGNSDTVYVVMDVRNVEDVDVQRNIMQCGTDFAGSSGFVGKKLIIFALNDDECATEEGLKSAVECENEFRNGVSFHVLKGDDTVYYRNRAEVGVNETYVNGLCGVHVS